MKPDSKSIADVISSLIDLFDGSKLSELGVFEVSNCKVITPIATDTLAMLSYRTSLSNQLREWSTICSLFQEIKLSPNYKGINHVGFCYKVDSTAAEAKRIIELVKANGTSLYREESNDGGDWLFVGDISDITNPVLELIPHEGGTTDRWERYWLPHIQFDIDTGLSPEALVELIRKYINEPGVPYSIQIDGVTYIQRVWLGCSEGVNIYLDLSTSNRDINYRKTWTRLA